MLKRMILMLAIAGVVVGALAFVKFRQFQEGAAQAAAFQPPPEAVTTITTTQQRWPTTLSVIGTAAAVQGVTVSADLPGIVQRISFESGASVREGDVLVQLDTKQEQAQMAAAEAGRELAGLNFERLEGLVSEGAVARAEFDRAGAEQKRTEAQIGEIRATIARKTIRAPFSGVLGLRQVNLGQYMSGGDPVVPLQSLNPIYVNFGVPQQDAGPVRVGRTVHIATDDAAAAPIIGRITAINSVVDATTRNVEVQATVANPTGRLRPGMFVEVDITLGADRDIVALPASAISYAPYGDSVYVVADLKNEAGMTYRGVRQQFVKLGDGRGDQIAVLSGLKTGEEVVTSGVFKLRNGAAVMVNNKVQPGNQLAPTPEDN